MLTVSWFSDCRSHGDSSSAALSALDAEADFDLKPSSVKTAFTPLCRSQDGAREKQDLY